MDFQTDIVPMQGYKYDHHYFEAGNLEAINEQRAGDGRLNAWLVLEIVTENRYLVLPCVPLALSHQWQTKSILLPNIFNNPQNMLKMCQCTLG